jgi:hypothetical protein
MRCGNAGQSILLVLFVSSCGSNSAERAQAFDHDCNAQFEQDVRQRAALEFSCPANELTVEDLGGWAYRVVGCGEHATYECDGCVHDVCNRAVHDDPVPSDAG